MAQQIEVKRFTDVLFELLDETFVQVHGNYLDKGTSLFETLATISADEASRPVSATCASIASQVEHVRFYVHVLERHLRGETVEKIDWQASWQITQVTDEEWQTLQQRLRDAYQSVLGVLKRFESWDGEEDISGALSILVHTAYHLGEIRQALCVVQR